MKAYLFALAGAVLWGLAPILGKLGLVSIEPTLALSIRTFFISLILLLWFLATGQWHNLTGLPSKSLLYLVGEGLLASLLGHLAYYYALKYGEASRVAPVMASYPLLTVFLAVLLLGEKFSWYKLTGALLILGGVIFLRK